MDEPSWTTSIPPFWWFLSVNLSHRCFLHISKPAFPSEIFSFCIKKATRMATLLERPSVQCTKTSIFTAPAFLGVLSGGTGTVPRFIILRQSLAPFSVVILGLIPDSLAFPWAKPSEIKSLVSSKCCAKSCFHRLNGCLHFRRPMTKV